VLWATDFLTTEIWTSLGLTTFYVLFFIQLSTRRVVLGGITVSPNEQWMKQVARNVSGWDGEMKGAVCPRQTNCAHTLPLRPVPDEISASADARQRLNAPEKSPQSPITPADEFLDPTAFMNGLCARCVLMCVLPCPLVAACCSNPHGRGTVGEWP